ncbi:hypothetical protein DSECCO2_582930 [anaerobic digester metagenome]
MEVEIVIVGRRVRPETEVVGLHRRQNECVLRAGLSGLRQAGDRRRPFAFRSHRVAQRAGLLGMAGFMQFLGSLDHDRPRKSERAPWRRAVGDVLAGLGVVEQDDFLVRRIGGGVARSGRGDGCGRLGRAFFGLENADRGRCAG